MFVYSPDYFFCLESEPHTEWFFSLLFIGISFIGFFVFYFIKIYLFVHKYPGYPLSAFTSRILLLLTLLIHGISQIIEGFAYKYQWKVGYFKFIISHFSQYLTSSTFLLLLSSWMKIYTSCHSPAYFKDAMRLYQTFIWFTAVMFIIFVVLVVIKYHMDITTYYYTLLSVDIARNAITVIVFFATVRTLSKITGRFLACFLGNPGDYLSTLCFSTGMVLFIGLCVRIVLLVYLTLSSECSENNLFLSILLQCIGYLLPLGFISVIDTILPDPSKEAIKELTTTKTTIASPYAAYV